MEIALYICQFLLGVAFIMFGSMKAFQYEKAKLSLPFVKVYSRGFITFIGLAEVLGGIGVILPNVLGIAPVITPIAAFGLALIMLLAARFHYKRKEVHAIGLNVFLLTFALFVALGRLWY